MSLTDGGSDLREAATLVLPGGVGLGLGVFVGQLVESLAVAVVLGVLGAVVGHAVGYWLLRRRAGGEV